MKEVLSEPEYEKSESGDIKKLLNKERSEEFITSLERKLFRLFSGVESESVDDYVLNEAMVGLYSQYKEIKERVEIAFLSDEKIKDVFTLGKGLEKPLELKYEPLSGWTFNKWIVVETALSMVKGEYLEEEGSNEEFLLPLVFGEWSDELPNLEQKRSFFNSLPALTAAPLWAKATRDIGEIKNEYEFIYSGSKTKRIPEMQKHFDIFGWDDALRNLAEEGIFGTYIDCKKAPLSDVMDYLNCSISYQRALSKINK